MQNRPHFYDYVKGLIADFTPLSGDRKFGEDAAIVGGLGRFRGDPICIIGQEGRRHNFAAPSTILACRDRRAIARR